MKIEDLIYHLPEKPRKGMLDWAVTNHKEELGGELVLFNRESVTIEPPLMDVMSAEDYAERERKIVRRWGARCSCTACGEDFIAGYISHGGSKVPSCGGGPKIRGIRLYQGEDGLLYSGYCGDEYAGNHYNAIQSTEIAESEEFNCPECGELVKLVHSGDLRNGRTYQLLIASVENVQGYTAVVTWLVSRRADPYGYFVTSVRPREAAVVSKKAIRCFTHALYGQWGETDNEAWRALSRFSDSMQKKYYDWPSAMHKKVGGWCWPDVPGLAGQTGEKTGLAEYIKGGGNWPVTYLKLWSKRPNIENIVKAGWVDALESGIDEAITDTLAYRQMMSDVELNWINWSEVKPHRMLGVTRREVKEGRAWRWTWQHMQLFQITQGYYSREMSATEFNGYCKLLGLDGIDKINSMVNDGYSNFELPVVVRYLQKQSNTRPDEGVQLLVDYRTAVDSNSVAGEQLTHEQLWPRDLLAAHDRATEIEAHKDDKKYQAGFDRVLEKCGAIEWTDGELCIRLPRSNSDLIAEGNKLRHCVGGYGADHIAGKHTIFFIRKYRRPERSYYSVDINMTGPKPKETQLHGYGNERHGPSKEHRHKVPTKVREFCDRWKEEVLEPWWIAETQKKKETKPKKKGGNAA